jgi:hypothetical protein
MTKTIVSSGSVFGDGTDTKQQSESDFSMIEESLQNRNFFKPTMKMFSESNSIDLSKGSVQNVKWSAMFPHSSSCPNTP